jgi:hypothetical protein
MASEISRDCCSALDQRLARGSRGGVREQLYALYKDMCKRDPADPSLQWD